MLRTSENTPFETARKVSDVLVAWPYGLPRSSFWPISCSAYRPNSRLERCSAPFRTVSLVHLHYRFRVVSYSSGHEISNLRTFTFGKGASDSPSRATLQRRFHPAPFADAPSFFEEGGGPANSEESGLRPANGAGCHPRLQRQRRGGPDGQSLAPPANPRCLRRGQR